MNTCIFCEIVQKNIPAHVVWEDDNHLAFLSIFPNTEGVTVVIPKKHYPSYVFDLPDVVAADLVAASKKVAGLLDKNLDDVGRTAMVFEGFGVDHIHAKLFPMHGTKDMGAWKPIESAVETYFEKYPGYISSHDCKKVSQEQLAATARKIRGEK